MNKRKTLIKVTKSFLPPIDDYILYLQKIWESHHLTNHGPLVEELETKLRTYLGVKHLFFVSNGTIALQIAIKALGLHGEIITTPFSYVATTSTIVWEGCQPVFVDIDPLTLCIDPNLIEAAITEQTSAILATHVYGIPCAVEQIQAIADKLDLNVIYDAAHTFGGKYKDKAISSYGDISTLSFHATKVFHTAEGGAIITDDDDLAHDVNYMRNFGHKDEEEFWGLGINGKNTELHAAMGLCILPKVPELIAKRKLISEHYDGNFSGSAISKPERPEESNYNYAYYPVIFKTEMSLIKVVKELNENNIYPRRYFFPSLNKLSYIQTTHMPVSEDISTRILCLPLSPYLTEQDVDQISSIILDVINGI